MPRGNAAALLGVGTLLSILLLLVLLTTISRTFPSVKTETEVVTSTTVSTSTTTGLQELTFEQKGFVACYIGCGTVYTEPWSVTLWNGAVGNLTLSYPPDTTIPTNECDFSTSYQNDTITFTVPFGVYGYRATTGAGSFIGQVDFELPNIPVQVPIASSCTG